MALTILPVGALFQAGIAATAPLIDIATLAGRHKSLFALNTIAVGLAGAALLFWSDAPVVAILVAGSIGFARVIVMSVWLVGSRKQQSRGAVVQEPVNDQLLVYRQAA